MLNLEEIGMKIISEIKYKCLQDVIVNKFDEYWEERLLQEARRESKYFWEYLKEISSIMYNEY